MANTLANPAAAAPPDGDAWPLDLRLFGPLEARVRGRPLPPLRSRQGRWLLALLALRAGKALPRASLAATLWPGSPEALALDNLRRALTNLRRALGPEAERLQSPEPNSLRLELAGAQYDVLAFDRAVAQGDTAALEGAVALYIGPLLEGCPGEWVFPEREAREQAYLAGLETLAVRALAGGNPEGAVGHLRMAVAVDPLRESAQRRLMEALAAAGEHGAAKRTYRDLRLLLHRELNAEPASETTALFTRIEELEQHRAAPARRSLPPGYLPRPVSSLVGREAELRELGARLHGARLVTLTGEGGVGKTRLALAAAEARIPFHADGVWFVDLAPLADPALLPPAVCAALGITEEPPHPLLATLVRKLRSRSTLLVLDNCEQLLDACAGLIEALLRDCRDVRVLATSRQPLGLPGEAVWRVPSLPSPPVDWRPPADTEPAPILARYAAVQLFVERAMLARPLWQPDRGSIRTVAQICRRLDGNPLAIELAAARVRALPVEQIQARLDDRFRLLTGGSRTRMPRQQTLEWTLDWSYDLLCEAGRALLRRLSIFAGGCTLEAVEAVSGCGARPGDAPQPVSDAAVSTLPAGVLDLLTGLVDKSLVVYDEEDGAGRYRLLETVRQYGKERLEECAEAAAVQVWHRDYFLELAEAAALHLHGPEQASCVAVLDREHGNMFGALEAALTGQAAAGRVSSAEAALRLGGALWPFWLARGHVTAGRAHLERALLLAEQASPPDSLRALSRARHGLGSLALNQGDYAVAQAQGEASLASYRLLGDLAGVADSLNTLASVARARGVYPLARSLYEESRALGQQLGERWGVATATEGLAVVAYFQADYPAASHYCDAALVLRRSLGDRRGVSRSLGTLGHIARHRGDLPAAREFFEEGSAICRELGDQDQLAHLLNSLGDLARLQGDGVRATRLLEEALSLRQALGDVCGVANSRHDLALVALDLDDCERAGALAKESLITYRALADQRGVAWAQLTLGRIAVRRRNSQSARDFFRESLARRGELGDGTGIAECLEALAVLENAVGEPARSARLLGAAERSGKPQARRCLPTSDQATSVRWPPRARPWVRSASRRSGRRVE